MLAALLVVLAGAATLVHRARGTGFSYSGPDAPAFSFRYDGLKRAQPSGHELVRLERSTPAGLRRRLTVEPLPLAPADDPISTTLPFAIRPVAEAAARRYAGYRQVVEGRTRLGVVDREEAYMTAFIARGAGPKPDGGKWVGKVLLVPEPGGRPRRALQITLLERVHGGDLAEAVHRFPAGFLLNWPIRFWVQQRTSVDTPDELERPLLSFSIG
jgi:hypothetical protein